MDDLISYKASKPLSDLIIPLIIYFDMVWYTPQPLPNENRPTSYGIVSPRGGCIEKMVDSPSMKPSTTSLESSPLEDSCIPTTTAGKDAADETTCMSRSGKWTKNQSMKMMRNIGAEISADAHDECKDDTSAIATEREERDGVETSFSPIIAKSKNTRKESTKSNTRKESNKSNRFRFTESMASMKSKGPTVSTVPSTAPVDRSVKKNGNGSWKSPFKGASSTLASKMVSMESKGSAMIKKEVVASKIKPPSEVLESVDDLSVEKPSLGENRDEMVAQGSAIQEGVIKSKVKNLSEFDIVAPIASEVKKATKLIRDELNDMNQQQQSLLHTQHNQELMLQEKVHELEKQAFIVNLEHQKQLQRIAESAASLLTMASLALERQRETQIVLLFGKEVEVDYEGVETLIKEEKAPLDLCYMEE